jgi:hypothetical protein
MGMHVSMIVHYSSRTYILYRKMSPLCEGEWSRGAVGRFGLIGRLVRIFPLVDKLMNDIRSATFTAIASVGARGPNGFAPITGNVTEHGDKGVGGMHAHMPNMRTFNFFASGSMSHRVRGSNARGRILSTTRDKRGNRSIAELKSAILEDWIGLLLEDSSLRPA